MYIDDFKDRVSTRDRLHHFSFIGGSTEEIKRMLDLNVLGLSVCTKEALQSLKERGVDDGHIIRINRLLIFRYI
jgi:short-subunit dehydrogenase